MHTCTIKCAYILRYYNYMYIYHIHTLKTTAFSGTFCEEDRNGCSEIQCFEGVECMDVPAPGVGAVCGSCPDGYTGDASKCYGEPLFLIITKFSDRECYNNTVV